LKNKLAVILPSLAATAPIFVARDIVNGLVDKDWHVDVFYFSDVVEVFDFKGRTKKISFLSRLNMNEYDVVHSHLFRADLFVYLNNVFSLNGKKKCISTVHSMVEQDLLDHYGYFLSRFFSFIWIKSWSKINNLVVLSDIALNYYRSSLPKEKNKFIKINNGRNVDPSFIPDDFLTIKETLSKFKLEGKTVIGTCCIVRVLKGLDQVLKALVENSNLIFVVIGDGPYLETLQKKAKELQVEKQLISLGRKENAFAYMPLFDVYVMPSLSEGFGLALLEAVAMKVPVVCSNLPVFQEIFNDKEVTFFSLNNISSLDLAFSIANKHLENKEIAFQRYLTKYTVQSMVDNYHNLFVNVRGNT
jgi:glycosyltransferase involved in cell wall biosynthesis